MSHTCKLQWVENTVETSLTKILLLSLRLQVNFMMMCLLFVCAFSSNKKFAYVNVLGGAVFPIKTWRVFYSKIMVQNLHPKPKVVRKVLRLNFRHVKVARLQSLFRDIFARVRPIWQKSSNRSSSIFSWLVFMHFSNR